MHQYFSIHLSIRDSQPPRAAIADTCFDITAIAPAVARPAVATDS
jgi:hypothetical protein